MQTNTFFMKEIKLLEEENANFPEQSVKDFISCCQNQPININASNIFYLNYLSKKYSVQSLEEKINEVISQNKGALAIRSLLFNLNINQNCISTIKTEDEENIIAKNFK